MSNVGRVDQMNNECCNRNSLPSLSKYSHSEVKPSGQEREEDKSLLRVS